MSSPERSIRLVCWNEARAAELAAELEAAGFTVEAGALDADALRTLRRTPPHAVVIDLGRLPSQGRDVGIMLRTSASSRSVPLVFVDGAEEKVARIRELLPDAVYTLRNRMAAAVERAIAEPPEDPVVPSSNLAGYSGTPLPKKLGIKSGSSVALVDAPDGFDAILGELPEEVTITHGASSGADVTLWFVRSLAGLEAGVVNMAEKAGDGRLWIVWPKRASGAATDLTQNDVRATGLDTGLVDFKICAVDATWSGLCFTRRKT